jgi:Concanavalin A-like lectin/glucanases superfamily
MSSVVRRRGQRRGRRFLTGAVVSAVLAVGLGVVPVGDTEPGRAVAAGQEDMRSVEEARAQAEASGERVEVLSLRSERSTIVANPDGTFTQTESVQPVRVRKDGTWRDIDTTLERQPDGSWAPKASVTAMSFSAGEDRTFARVEKDGRSLSLDWLRDLPEPVVEGSTATYTDVLPGVDLRLTAEAEGFSHVLVVKNAEAAANPELTRLDLPVHTQGLDLARTDAGVIEGRDASGAGVVFEAPQPLMWDSGSAREGADGGTSAAAAKTGTRVSDATVEEAVVTDDGAFPPEGAQVADVGVHVSGQSLALEPDTELLTSPDTTFPVYIDPVVKTANRSAWTMVSSYYSSAEFWKFSDHEGVGRCPADTSYQCASSNDVKRQFFAIPTGTFEGKDIIKAEFAVTMVHTYNSSGRSVQLGRVNSSGGSAISSATNWSNQPSLKETIASQSPTNPAGSCTSTNQNVRFDVKSTVQKAADSGWSTTTFRLRAGDESDYSYWKRFCGNAHLEVTYNRPPLQPAMRDLKMTPGGSCEYGHATEHYVSEAPKLTAVIQDYDHGDTGSNSESVKAQFHVWWTSGSTQVDHYATTVAKSTRDSSWSDQTGVATFTYTVGSDLTGDGEAGFTIPQNTVIAWEVRGNDGTSYGPWSTGGDATRCEFIYDSTSPKAPVVTSAQYPDNEEWTPGVGDYGTFNFDSPSTDVVRYKYRFTGEGWEYSPVRVPGWPVSVKWMPPDEGPMSVEVLAVDGAGNAQLTPTSYNFNVADGRAPAAGWSLGDAAGSTQAAGTSGSPAAVAGSGVTFGAEGPLGAADTAVRLDGTEDAYLDAGQPAVDTGGTFSVSAWVNLAERPTDDVTVVSQDGTGQPGFELGYDVDTASWTFQIPMSDMESLGAWKVSGATAVPGSWMHLTGVYDEVTGMMSLFVNGDLLESGVQPRHTAWNATGGVQIGRKLALDGYTGNFKGSIADVRIYDRVVSEAEGQRLGGVTAHQLAYWPVDSVEGGVSPDIQGGTGLTLGGGASIYVPDDSCDPGLDPDCVPAAEPLWGDGNLELNGSDGYATRASGLLAGEDSFTVTARARLAAAVPTTDQTVFSLSGADGSAATVKYLAAKERWAVVTTDADGAGAVATSTVAEGFLPSSEGDGDHLTLVYSAVFGDVLLYVNGTLAVKAQWSNTWDFSTASLQVGRSLDGGTASGYFAGAVDELRAFRGDLDAGVVGKVAYLVSGESIEEPT